VSPTSYFLRVSKDADRQQVLKQLAGLGIVHDDLEHDHIMVIISYLAELKSFHELRRQWEASGRVRVLDMGG
jgi:hypothetical protein